MTTTRENWGHIINPTPGQQRRAALVLLGQAIGSDPDITADHPDVRDALKMLGVAPYTSKPVRMRGQ